MKHHISYNTLLARLAETIPQLAPAYDRESAQYAPEAVPPYVFVEDQLVPYLIHQLEQANELEIKRCFSFLEELASSSDPHIPDLLGAAVAEPLIANAKALALALPAAGPRLRAAILRVRDWPAK